MIFSQLSNLFMKRSSIALKFEQNINKCDICYCPYNRQERKPVIICSMHHTICNQCMNALKIKPECPFCREKIRFEKVVVNNYIYQLLPGEEVRCNQRIPVTPSPAPSPPINSYIADNPQMERIHTDRSRISQPAISDGLSSGANNEQHQISINNRPVEHIYPQYTQYNRYNPLGEQVFHLGQQDEGWTSAERVIPYCCFLCLQLPFTFFNLFLAISSPQSQCMDKPHRSSVLVVRPWMLSMGIIESVLMILLLLSFGLYKARCFSVQHLHPSALIYLPIRCYAYAVCMSASLKDKQSYKDFPDRQEQIAMLNLELLAWAGHPSIYQGTNLGYC